MSDWRLILTDDSVMQPAESLLRRSQRSYRCLIGLNAIGFPRHVATLVGWARQGVAKPFNFLDHQSGAKHTFDLFFLGMKVILGYGKVFDKPHVQS